ncbi:MAG: hypothetical protein JEZ06_18215 [Anaerolineaceae bacterium]|nr:hypothetical protein [Anaerolineaceae bacterium]
MQEQFSVVDLDEQTILSVALLMSRLKPEWWQVDTAREQLQKVTGWVLLGADELPIGWMTYQTLPLYNTIEIETIGYDQHGKFIVGEMLTPLLEECINFAAKNNISNIRFIIGSRGLSCHGQTILKPWETLKNIEAINRPEFDWLISMGFSPHGILPNIYGKRYHGIMLIKTSGLNGKSNDSYS